MKLEFIDGQENLVITEGADKRDSSLFKVQYALADKILEGISGDTAEYKERRSYNNIIAFCGDRGTGKTSCMMSFRNQLQKNTDAEYEKAVEGKNEEGIKQTKKEYEFLDAIDPSFFDETHNILELVLGNMYRSIERKKDEKAELFNKVVVEFNKVMRYMKYLSSPQEKERFYDALQELESLSAGLELQKKISDLFALYLELMGGKLLIITIDDLDLNIQGAYTMSEYIRKYLTNEHCIILLSVKIDQLVEAIKLNIIKSNNVSMDEAHNMAVKYVTKLLPLGNRVNMPDLEDYCNYELDYIVNGQTVQYHSVKESVTHVIFWKTGYLFYNSKGRSSYIVPRNLRSLRQLLHLLNTLPVHDKTKPEILHESQRIFKNYFYRTWTQQLTDKYNKVVNMILANDNYLTFNKTVVSQLATIRDFSKNDELSSIVNPSNYAYNVSMGDVMNVLEYLSQDESDHQLQLLVFFVRSLCSMKLYEAYDQVTENMNTEHYPAKANDDKSEIYSTDALFDRANALQKLVNGQYFNFEKTPVIAPQAKSKYSRSFQPINGEKLGQKLKELVEKPALDDNEKKLFRLIEFFMLTTSRYQRMHQTFSSIDKNRTISDPEHLMDFTSQTKNLVFDVVSIFYNVLNLKVTYNKFSEYIWNEPNENNNLYKFAIENDWTLLNKMINGENRNYDDSRMHGFLSDAVLRNAEVISAVTELIRSNRYKIKGENSKDYLKKFYNAISNTDMRTYQAEKGADSYKIEFYFLTFVQRVLEEANIDFFDSIYGELDEEGLVTFERMFTGRSYRQSTILNKLRDARRDVYNLKSLADWRVLFPADQDISREEVIAKINIVIGNN